MAYARNREFRVYKNVGKDNNIPALLQNGCEVIIKHLHIVYVICLVWGLTATAGSNVNVIYIPKAGNRPGNQPKFLRPHCHTEYSIVASKEMKLQTIWSARAVFH